MQETQNNFENKSFDKEQKQAKIDSTKGLSSVQNCSIENKENVPVDDKLDRVQKQRNVQRNTVEYERMPSYIKAEDWKIDEKNGGVILHNKAKKSMMPKLVGYICKRVISTGSFMGISFPTFGMKPESILETYCKCLGAAPLILENVQSSSLQRIKAFNTVALTISLQFNDIEKPFNPTLGETFQGEIAGNLVYAEQISHQPPVASFILFGKGYTFSGTLELNARLSMNSATGLFYGDLTLQFNDGGIVKGRIPNGLMSGMVFGQTKLIPQGAVYSFDPKSKLVCSYFVKEKDVFVGHIGKLLPRAQQDFFKKMNEQSKQRYEKFEHIQEKQYECISARLQIVWSKQVSYDGRTYFSFKEPKNLPFRLTQNVNKFGENLLKSDSSWREDIKLRSQQRMEESQKQKQRIEDEERVFRKLREDK